MNRKKIALIAVIWLLTLILMFFIARSDKTVNVMLEPALSPDCILVLNTVEKDTFLQQYIHNPERRCRIQAAEKKLR